MNKNNKNKDEFKKHNTTLSDLKNRCAKITYIINHDVHIFAIPDDEIDEEVPLAYCFKLKKWAWLYDDAVYFKNEYMVPAAKIQEKE